MRAQHSRAAQAWQTIQTKLKKLKHLVLSGDIQIRKLVCAPHIYIDQLVLRGPGGGLNLVDHGYRFYGVF